MSEERILKYQDFAPLILRIGIAIVFLLFGLKKLMDPNQATAEIQLLLNFELADAAALNFYLGLVEILISFSFITGLKVRTFALVSSFLTAMFFASFFAKYGFSINPDLYRDIGLTAGGLALFILGAGKYSMDEKFFKKHAQ